MTIYRLGCKLATYSDNPGGAILSLMQIWLDRQPSAGSTIRAFNCMSLFVYQHDPFAYVTASFRGSLADRVLSHALPPTTFVGVA